MQVHTLGEGWRIGMQPLWQSLYWAIQFLGPLISTARLSRFGMSTVQIYYLGLRWHQGSSWEGVTPGMPPSNLAQPSLSSCALACWKRGRHTRALPDRHSDSDWVKFLRTHSLAVHTGPPSPYPSVSFYSLAFPRSTLPLQWQFTVNVMFRPVL